MSAQQHAVADVTAVRPRLPVAGKRRHDDIRLDRPETLIGEAETLGRTGSVVLRDDVAMCRQLVDNLYRFGTRQIQLKAALALVPLVEAAAAVEPGLALMEGR